MEFVRWKGPLRDGRSKPVGGREEEEGTGKDYNSQHKIAVNWYRLLIVM